MLGFAAGAAILAVIAAAALPRSIAPRRYGHEKPDDAATVAAYARASRGLVLSAERWLVLRELKRFQPVGVLLDVGCGPGYLAVALAQRYSQLQVTGVDVNEDMLAYAREIAQMKRAPAVFRQGDAAALPFPDSAADFIVSTGMLHHLVDGRPFFHQVYRVLRPGGRFLILDLRRDAPRWLAAYVSLYQLAAPRAIRVQNGPLGSLWASYTPREAAAMLATQPFRETEVKRGAGWFIATGTK